MTAPSQTGSSAGNAAAPMTVPAGTVWQMYRAMVGVGILCGLLIVSVYLWTLPIIERNKAEALKAAVFQVLPGAASSASFAYTSTGAFVPLGQPGETSGAMSAEGETAESPGTTLGIVHAGYDEAGDLVGIAIEAAGMGYQDMIRFLYGYDPTAQTIVGFQVLESKETPGLGDKIITNEAFLTNFEALDVTLTDDARTLRNPVTFVKAGEKQNAWEIDGITGATISSNAVARALRESTLTWMPRIHPQAATFRSAGRPEASP